MTSPRWQAVGAWARRVLGRQVAAEGLLVVTLFAFTVGERAYLASHRHIMEAGDTFNFLFIAQAYSQGRIPQGEKRLPLYPLAILAGWKGLGLDPYATATGVAVLAGGVTTVLLYLLGRKMGIHQFPLVLMLILLVIDPVTNSVGIRPLADALFLCLVVAATYAVTVAGRSVRAALAAGGVIGLLMLTRFESMVLAPVLVGLLRFRMLWKRVAIAALPVLALYIAWVPYSLHVHGTVTGGYFEEWGPKEGAVGGKLADVPEKLAKIARGLGWSRPWEHPAWALEQPDRPALAHVVASPAWWISLLAVIGVPWLLLTARARALPFLGVFFTFTTLYSMWVVYGRFVAPGVPAFYIAAAAGGSAVYAMLRRLFPPRLLALAASALFSLVLLQLVRLEAPALLTSMLARVYDNEGSGYSMVLAVRDLAKREGRVAMVSDLMPILYLGLVDDADAPPQRAFFVDHLLQKEPPLLANELRARNIRYLIDRGEPRIERVVAALRERGVITDTEEIRYPKGQPPIPGEFDVTRIHTLEWARRGPRSIQ